MKVALTLRHLARGETSISINTNNNYFYPDIKKASLALQVANPIYTDTRIDLDDRNAIEAGFAGNKNQQVVNPASQAGASYSIENPLAYIDSNIVGFSGSEAMVAFLPAQLGKVTEAYADVSDLQNQFDYETSTPISIGLANFVGW